MGEVKASDPAAAAVAAANSVMPVSSVTMCEESEDVHGGRRAEASVCPESTAVDSAPPSSSSSLLGGTASLLAGDSEDSLSVVTEVDYSVSSPDSGHGTSQDGQSEEICLAVNTGVVQVEAHHLQDISADISSSVIGHVGASEYSWINGGGPHTSVMEPVAINPETGFTTVLVDASAVGGYPHAPPGAWPPGGYSIPSPHLHPHPPPHFHLHSHAFVGPEMVPSDYGYMTTGYESVHAPHYEPVSPMYHDPSIHHQHLTGDLVLVQLFSRDWCGKLLDQLHINHVPARLSRVAFSIRVFALRIERRKVGISRLNHTHGAEDSQGFFPAVIEQDQITDLNIITQKVASLVVADTVPRGRTLRGFRQMINRKR